MQETARQLLAVRVKSLIAAFVSLDWIWGFEASVAYFTVVATKTSPSIVLRRAVQADHTRSINMRPLAASDVFQALQASASDSLVRKDLYFRNCQRFTLGCFDGGVQLHSVLKSGAVSATAYHLFEVGQ